MEEEKKEKVEEEKIEKVEEFDISERGNNGFGSSDKNNK